MRRRPQEPKRVTVPVRGAPALNDATLADAQAVGLVEITEVKENGSDAPGTILAECSREFQRRFSQADLVIAKGQGSFESLSEEPGPLFFLFRVKCQMVAEQVGLPAGSSVVLGPRMR